MSSSMQINIVKPGGPWGLWAGLGLRRWCRRIRSVAGDDHGSILLESVVASMVFAMVGVAVLSGLSTTYSSGARVDVQSTAENVARNQLEHVFNQTYAGPLTPYPTYTGVPAGYTVTTTATDMATPDPDIERVNVSVTYNGATIVSVNTLRFNEP